MKIRSKRQIKSVSPDQTEKIAEKIGNSLKGGEVIELSSDLGGGKTTFVRGLARGARSVDNVSSPSFTIKNVYNATKFEIWHFDFYRLDNSGMTGLELSDAIGDQNIVTVIEWAKDTGDILPDSRLKIDFFPTDDDSRKLIIDYPSELEYLLELL